MATAPLKTIGLREFREHFAQHMSGETPLAITQHGLTIGYYIPVQRSVSETDRHALAEVTRRLHTLLEAQGIDPEDLLNDYAALRKTRTASRDEATGP